MPIYFPIIFETLPGFFSTGRVYAYGLKWHTDEMVVETTLAKIPSNMWRSIFDTLYYIYINLFKTNIYGYLMFHQRWNPGFILVFCYWSSLDFIITRIKNKN